MSRCFRELGLRENATPSEVKIAYGRKIERYKGPDYAEEPEYVAKKLAQLHDTYEEAMRLASRNYVGGAEEPLVVSKKAEGRTVKKVSSTRLRDAERSAAEHGFREKFHQWMEGRDEDKARKSNRKSVGVKKKSSGKLSDKFSERKKLNLDNVKAAWDEFKADVSAGLSGEDDFNSLADSGESLNEGGTVVAKPKEKKKSGGGELVSLIISMLILGISIFGSCGDDSISYEEEYDYVDEYGTVYTYDYLGDYDSWPELDYQVKDLAEGTYEQLYTQDSHGSAHWSIDEDEDLRPVADQFAEKYWGMESIEDVTEYLYDQYPEYPATSDMTLDQQLNYILPFYGFMVVDEAQWYDNPYTGERIQCFADYLEYLIECYDEM